MYCFKTATFLVANFLLLLTACNGIGGVLSTTPNAFSFMDRSNVALNTVITSNSITVTGIGVATAISVSDGEYSIAGSAFTSVEGMVSNGQMVSVRHTSSAFESTMTSTLLTIGGVSDAFISTTGSITTGFSPSTGSLDMGFNRARGLNNTVRSMSLANDGSGDVYVGGDFSHYNDTASSRLIRVNSDGSADTAFNIGTSFNSTVWTVSAATDGSTDVYVGGSFTEYNGTGSNYIIRLNDDGSVDTAFNIGSGLDNVPFDIIPASDGSGDVYVGGTFNNYNGTGSNRIIRLNDDGSLDTAFNVGTGFDSAVFNITPTTDGSGDVYVSGDFNNYNGTGSNKIIRLNDDGSVDVAFNIGSGFDGLVRMISTATDGSGDVYVAGNFSTYDGTGSNRIIRLNDDGSVDAAFNIGSGFDAPVRMISPVPDSSGDVYVAGEFSSYDGTASSRLIRLNDDGSIDASFNVGTGFSDDVISISPATDGSGDLYAVGDFLSFNGSGSKRLIRLNNDGSAEAAFTIGGGFNFSVFSISPAIDSGDVYVGGNFSEYNGTGSSAIIRLTNLGSVNPAFNIGSGFNASVSSVSLVTDGSGDVYAGGSFTSYNGTASNRLIRLNNDGSVDVAFNVGTGFDSSVYNISPATDDSGDVYVGGDFTSYDGTASSRLIRLNDDGSVDATFNVGTGFNVSGFLIGLSIAPATDGSGDIYVGGNFDDYNGSLSNRLIRLNDDGSVDAAFNVGTGLDGGAFSLPESINPATDGSGDIYVGGFFSGYNGIGSNNLVRLNSDGSVDAAFNVGTGLVGIVSSISPATDDSNQVYVGGNFTSYNGTDRNRLIRLNDDGSVDEAFNIGSGFDASVFSIALATDGSGDVFVGGDFTIYQSSLVDRIVRLN